MTQTTPKLTVAQATTETQIQKTRELFEEYFEFLRAEVDTEVDDLDDVVPLSGYREEMAGLPGKYAPPEGRLLLAEVDGVAAGCVAFYKLDDGVCEVKRLWARPGFRGQKVGRALMETLIDEARAAGYGSMLLSTVNILKAAHTLYLAVGFEVTEPYYQMPPAMMAREIFMKLDLAQKH